MYSVPKIRSHTYNKMQKERRERWTVTRLKSGTIFIRLSYVLQKTCVRSRDPRHRAQLRYIRIYVYIYICTYIYIYIPTILAAYKPRSAGTFRITGHVVTYPSRISLPLSASLVVHSRGTGGVISVTYAPRLKSR